MHKGYFITFEGGEGSGKTTQSQLLCAYLKKHGCDVVHTREPGGTKVAEAIRRILLDPENDISPLTELLLYEAGRAQHLHERVLPALKRGAAVICDRFTDATVAYQGYGRGLDTGIIGKLNRIASYGIVPDLTIYLDIPVTRGLVKARTLNREAFAAGDRLERESTAFHRRVRRGYLDQAKKNPRRIKVVRTGATIEETHEKIVKIVDKALF